jgi:hypothetical protein
MSGWDGNWYRIIIHDWYHANLPSAVFYPLYPFVVWIASLFGLINLTLASFIVNIVSLWLAIVALVKITRLLISEKYAYLPILFLLVSPSALFMHMFYTEALFLSIGLWSYLAALRKQWILMGALLAIITACRLPGLLFVALCFFEFLREHQWDIRNLITKKVLVFLLAPIGFVVYGLYLLMLRGDFLGMLHAYTYTSDWSYQHFNLNIIQTILRAFYQTLRAIVGPRPFDNDIFINHFLPVVALGFIVLSSLYLIFVQKKKFVPIGLFGLLSTVLFTLNNNVVSLHRYALPVIGIYLFLTLIWIRYRTAKYILIAGCLVSFLLQIYLLSQFINKVFVG